MPKYTETTEELEEKKHNLNVQVKAISREIKARLNLTEDSPDKDWDEYERLMEAATGDISLQSSQLEAEITRRQEYERLQATRKVKSLGKCKVCHGPLTASDVASTGRNDICHDCI